MDSWLWAKRTASKCQRRPRSALRRKMLLTFWKQPYIDFDHSEVEKASVKEVNGNRTAQSVMDRWLWAKRRASSCERRPRSALWRNLFLTFFKMAKFDFDHSVVEKSSVSWVNETQTLRYYMDRGLWAKRTGSRCVWGLRKKLRRNRLFGRFQIFQCWLWGVGGRKDKCQQSQWNLNPEN